MLFNSNFFLFCFLPTVILVFHLLKRWGYRYVIGWLVLSSLFFYGWWNPPYVLLILASITVNYTIGRLLGRHPDRLLLAFGVAANLATLGYYKYFNFFVGIFANGADQPFNLTNILLPLAISFYTFQQIAFLVDSYRQQVIAHTFLEYVLFVLFFPQLIAGPIVTHRDILPQFHRKALLHVHAKDIAIGTTLFAVGLFKKVAIADTMAAYATPMFTAAAAGEQVTLLDAWGGVLSYTFQLYFDFSGYSDMAIGLGRLFGIRLPLNFNSPYKATSIIDFWRRWHMTLSHFLRNYLYIPLGGNRLGSMRRYLNLLLVMSLGGLWHGANWTFLIWGFIHGSFLAINHGWRSINIHRGEEGRLSTKLRLACSWVATFTVVVIAWAFFRADNVTTAVSIAKGMLGLNGIVLPAGFQPHLDFLYPIIQFDTEIGLNLRQWIFIALLVILSTTCPNSIEWLYGMRSVSPSVRFENPIAGLLRWRRSWIHALLVLTIFFLSLLQMHAQPSEFIYYQF